MYDMKKNNCIINETYWAELVEQLLLHIVDRVNEYIVTQYMFFKVGFSWTRVFQQLAR